MFETFRRVTLGEVWDGCTSTIENGEESTKPQRGFSPGQGQGRGRFPRCSGNREAFEDLAGQIGGLWLIISLG